ncbi:MAG: hypothetical protein N4A33_07675 [Bacteriovoracaceae bacterium]|jgi:hypothetical protein|nr:hypothetical protein [Bacteriovoracaceae bacterium]
MKLLIFILLLSSFAHALEYKCKAIVRNNKHKLIISEVTLKDLTSKDSFSGKYIKVLRRNETLAVKFNSVDSLRACTVYYHGSKAKDFFQQNYDLKRLKRPRAIVMRIEMDLGFEESVHMMHQNNGLFYNNAVTIPPSGPGRITEKPWFYEIWFAPKKKVKIDNNTYKAAQLVSSGPFMSSMLLGVGQSQATTIGIDLIRGTGFGASFYAKTLALSLGVTALVPQVLKYVSKPFKKTIFLDTAMIPEVIYHEYTHYALSEHLPISRHSSTVEGIANFYAAAISNTDSILKNARKYSRGLVKVEAKKDKNYEYYMEDSKYAQLDFTFKFLYALNGAFGKVYAQKLVFTASKILGSRDSLGIKTDLIPALRLALDELGATSAKNFKLQSLIQKFGF